MNREILYRGLTVNGEWVYGSLTLWGSQSFITVTVYGVGLETEGKKSIIRGCIFEVIRETVGEYTGLKDKNGNKIFEGDVIRLTRDTSENRKAIWDNKHARFVLESDWCMSFECAIDCFDLEIIGNIWQNPDLLK